MVYDGAAQVLSLQELELRYTGLLAALDRERQQHGVPDKDALKAKFAQLHQRLEQGLGDILRLYEARRTWLARVISGDLPEPRGGHDAVLSELHAVAEHIKQHPARRQEMLASLVAWYGEEDMVTPDSRPDDPPWATGPPTSTFADPTAGFPRVPQDRPVQSGYGAMPPGYPNGSGFHGNGHPGNGWPTGSFPTAVGPIYPADADYPTMGTGVFAPQFQPPPGPGTGAFGRVPQGRHPGQPGEPPGWARPRSSALPAPPSARPAGKVAKRKRGQVSVNVRPGQIIPPGQASPPAVRSTRRGPKTSTVVVIALVIAVIALVMTRVTGTSSGYPANVNQVKQWISTACQNNNTAWPGNVQFACSTQGRNMLWAFSLITSDANPNYTGKQPGAQQRNGLMPVPKGLGEVYDIRLGLDHPYNPSNPVDSLEVAALILNTDVGGTVAFGSVQQGLMSDANNCTRYTGSAEQTTLSNGLTICKQNLTPQGQEALVEDLLGKWDVPGSSPAAQQEAATAARAAAVLYASPDKPNADAQRALNWIAAEQKAGKLLV